MNRYLSSFFIILFCCLLAGCNSSPVSPDTTPPDLQSTLIPDSGGHSCLGYFQFIVDPATNSIDVVPLRSTDIHLNLTGILNSTMGVSAAMVIGESIPAEGLFVLDISLSHPFGAKTQFSGFDVKGILMAPGSLDVDGLIFSDTNETRLENADGYSRWWNPTEFTSPGMFGYTDGILATAPSGLLTATVNPYKLFADVLTPTNSLVIVSDAALDSDGGRAVFTAGSTNIREYRIRFPMNPGPQIVFGYAIDVSWSAPVPNPPDAVPDDFPINANQPEAYRLVARPVDTMVYFDSESGVGGGVLRPEIFAFDWQGQDAGIITPEIDTVKLYCPDLWTGGIDCEFIEETTKRAHYIETISSDLAPTGPGSALVIAEVTSATGTYQQTGAPAPSGQLAAYHAFEIEIFDPECTNDANNDWLESVEITFDDPIIDQVCLPNDYKDFYHFTMPPGYEADGEIILWCDAEPTTLGVYDESHVLVQEQVVSGGSASLDFASLDLFPGMYYIRILTSNDTQTSPYMLEFSGELINVTPTNPVDVTPPWLFMHAKEVYYHENMVYMYGMGYVYIYDVTDISDPQYVSKTQISGGEFLCFNYPYMYLTDRLDFDETQVNLVDCSDPLNAVETLDVLHYMSDLEAVQMNSEHLYVSTDVSSASELFIYDYATDPMNPTQVGHIPSVPDNSRVLEFMDPEGPDTNLIIGTYSQVLTYSVEDPANISLIGTFTPAVSGGAWGLVANGDYIYLCYNESTGNSGMLYSLYQSPSGLFKVGDLDTPGSAVDIKLNAPYVYMANDDVGVSICDITNPAAPTHVSTTATLARTRTIDNNGSTIFAIPSGSGLQIFDASIPQSVVPASHLKVINSAYGMVARGDYMIIANSGGANSLKTIDISDPPNAHVVAELFVAYQPFFITSYGDIAATYGNKYIALYDISDPLNILPLTNWDEGEFIGALCINGNAVYVVKRIVGYPMRMYDITNPSAPHYEGTFNLVDSTWHITFKDNYMFISINPGLRIFDMTDPFLVNEVGSYSYSPWGYDQVEIRGNLMYAPSKDTLEVIDITNPPTPVFVGSTLVPADHNGYQTIGLDRQFAYISSYDEIARSVMIYPPDSPTYIAPVYDALHGHTSRDLHCKDGYLYDCADSRGLKIYDLY